MARKSLIGEQYGKLTVIIEAASISGRKRWLCKCECGNEKVIYASNLISGGSKSCGCSKGKKKTRPVIAKKKKMSALEYYMQTVKESSRL